MSYVVRIVFGKVINVSFFSCSEKKPDISIKVSVEGKIEDGNDTSDSEEGELSTKWAVIGINDSIEGNEHCENAVTAEHSRTAESNGRNIAA